MVIVWWSAASLIHYSFLNPSKTITSEKYALVVEAVSLQKLVKLLKEVIGWLARDQVNMVDEAKLCSPVCSTFEALCCGEELGPFC